MAKKKAGTDVPSNAVRKPTPKKSFSLNDFKKKIGAETVPSKPLEWIPIDKALQEATGMPGVPKGYVTQFRGYSNTGKSTALMKTIVNAQKMGILPIIIDTENNIDEGNERLTLMGFDWDGNYILVKNKFLLENFGDSKVRKEASIEDMAKAIFYFLDQQEAGNLEFDLLFAIDSIGILNCNKTILGLENDGTSNNMWNAAAYERSFLSMLNNVIPNSRRTDSPFINTMTVVQKVWLDNMNSVIKNRGGETFYFGARLIYHFGGIITHGTKRIVATSKKRELNYGYECKVNIAKNHVNGVSLQGKIISTPHGFVYPDNIDEYKKKYILYFRNRFEDDSLTSNDLDFKSKDMDADGNVIIINDLIERSPSIDENEE